MSIGNYITIALFVITLIITLITARSTKQAKVQAKADKADVKKIVKEELTDTHKEIKENQASIKWVKDAIHDIQLYNQLSAEKSKNTRRNIQETLDSQGETFKDFMEEQRSHNTAILEKIGTLVTEQAVMNEKKKDK